MQISNEMVSIVSEVQSLIELSKSQVVDIQISDLLSKPVYELQNKFSKVFRDNNDIAEAILPGLRGRESLNLANILQNDMDRLTTLTAPQRSLGVRLKSLIPKLIQNQLKAAEKRTQLNHAKAIQLIQEIRKDSEILVELDRNNRALILEFDRQIENEKSLRDYFQQQLWNAEKTKDTNSMAVLKAVLTSIESNIDGLMQTTTILGSLDIQIKSTSKNNQIVYDKLNALVIRDMPAVQIFLASKGIDIRPQDAQGNASESKAETVSSQKNLDSENFRAIDLVNEKLKGFNEESYFRGMENAVKGWKKVTVDDVCKLGYLLRNSDLGGRSPQFLAKAVKTMIFERVPLMEGSGFYKTWPLLPALLTSPVRIPILIGTNMLLGDRLQLSWSQAIFYSALKKLDWSQMSKDEFERLRTYLTVQYGKPNVAVYHANGNRFYGRPFFNTTLVKAIEKRWLRFQN
jgi:hypothetical protein